MTPAALSRALDATNDAIILRVLREREAREVGFAAVVDALIETMLRLCALQRIVFERDAENAALRDELAQMHEAIQVMMDARNRSERSVFIG